MSRLSALFPLIVAALLAAASFWLQRVVELEGAHQAASDRHDPDALVEMATLDRYNALGQLQYRLQAPHMRHYPDDDSSELDQPTALFAASPRRSEWRSDHAWVMRGGEEVLLTGKVRGMREATADSPRQSFATETLTILPDQERARTDAAVEMTQGRSRLIGTGMTLDNLRGKVEIRAARATLQRTPR